jgi:hypothetical protein
MWRLALAGIVVCGIAGCVNDHGGADTDVGRDAAPLDSSPSDARYDGGVDAGPCTPRPPPSGTGCHTNADCDATRFEMCYAPGASVGCPICVPPMRTCATDADCASTDYCDSYVDPCTPRTGFCNPSGDPTSTRCAPRCTATSCGDGFTCGTDGRCTAISCMSGYTCPAHMHCGDLAGGDAHGCFRDSCSTDADCGCGAACLMGGCYETLGACMPPAA